MSGYNPMHAHGKLALAAAEAPGKGRSRYHAAPIRQTLRDTRGRLIGCTDTAFAMAVDAATLGGVIVTESQVRKLSTEPVPDPESPGLNLGQLVGVAGKLRIGFADRTGDPWGDLVRELDRNARVVLQLWYPGIGGPAIGHAVYVEQVRDSRMRLVDPMQGRYAWMGEARVHKAARAFAERTGLATGVRWGVTRRTPWISDDQRPQRED